MTEMKTDAHPTSIKPTLQKIVDDAIRLNAVTKAQLALGDRVQVTTRNSVYVIHVLEDGFYLISGGWVALQGKSGMKTTIAGCTWGGAALKSDIVAASGLHLEFGQGIVTSTIRKVAVMPCVEGRFVH